MVQKLGRLAAWFILISIVFLTLVPPTLRPTTPIPRNYEHAAAFFADGFAFGIAYSRSELFLSIGAVIFCGAIEMSQIFVPGRHARLTDFMVDALAAIAGVLGGAILERRSIIAR